MSRLPSEPTLQGLLDEAVSRRMSENIERLILGPSIMNEKEWLMSDNPAAMLDHCRRYVPEGGLSYGASQHPHKLSDRKQRLFAVACCRQVWDGAPCGRCGGTGTASVVVGNEQDEWCPNRKVFVVGRAIMGKARCPDCHGAGRTGGLTDPRSRRAVEVAERYADGLATEQDLADAADRAFAALQAMTSGPTYDAHAVAAEAFAACRPNIVEGIHAGVLTTPKGDTAAQAALLREIVGNPFRPVGIDPAWRTPIVLRLAGVMYNCRRFADLPVLGDALEDAGCSDQAILDHCRGAGPHVRGCWALDLILGKE